MADNKELLAKRTFDTLCAALDHEGFRYEKDEEELLIKCTARGEDLPIYLVVKVDAERDLVSLFSLLSATVPEDKRVDMAVAVAIANYGMRWGHFDYNFLDGNILFRMTGCYTSSLLGEEFFRDMVYTAFSTVDQYNDRFLMLAKDIISIEQFVEKEKQ